MAKSSKFWKSLQVLNIIEKNTQEKLENTINFKENEYNKMLEYLKELELVVVENNKNVLTEKGRNTLNYFNRDSGLAGTPFIRIKNISI